MDDIAQHDITKLYEIVKQLRGPNGCPWDKEQTLNSLTPHVVEEAYELVDALNSGCKNELIEELGDVLLHVVMIATMAEEDQLFLFKDILNHVCNKMINRHPHVFGDKHIKTVEGVWQEWEKRKALEKKEHNNQELTLDSIPKQLPALAKAEKMQKRAARVGFDWPDIAGTLTKIKEELAEFETALSTNNPQLSQEEAGDLLFAITNTLRKLNINPEEALQLTNTKFQTRFNHMETALQTENKAFEDETLAELNQRWETAKLKLS